MTDPLDNLGKITLPGEDLWIIRATYTWPTSHPDEPVHSEVRYYESPSVWNSSPLKATIFREQGRAQAHINMYDRRDRAPKGWADGRTETLDAVLLLTEIYTSPNGVTINLQR